MKKKNGFLTFMFSMLPGAGHMYLGLLKQGVQLMILFFLSIFLADWLRLNILVVFAPVIWFYSFFDAMNKLALDELPNDELFFSSWFSTEGSWIRNKAKFIGYTLIILGIILLFERIMVPELEKLINWKIREYIQTGIVALLFIAGGVKLISGHKVKSLEGNGDKDI